MALASPKRITTTLHREVGVKQIEIELDLGQDHDGSKPRMSFPPKVHAALVRMMAVAIIAVHQPPQEAGDDDRRCES
jgi:hypothetical protein